MGRTKKEYEMYLLSKEETEELEKKVEELDSDMDEIPQHVIDEAKVDEAIMRMHDQAQMEMYDDPYLNWSGLR